MRARGREGAGPIRDDGGAREGEEICGGEGAAGVVWWLEEDGGSGLKGRRRESEPCVARRISACTWNGEGAAGEEVGCREVGWEAKRWAD